MMDKLSEKLSVVKSNASEIAKLVEELSKKMLMIQITN